MAWCWMRVLLHAQQLAVGEEITDDSQRTNAQAHQKPHASEESIKRVLIRSQQPTDKMQAGPPIVKMPSSCSSFAFARWRGSSCWAVLASALLLLLLPMGADAFLVGLPTCARVQAQCVMPAGRPLQSLVAMERWVLEKYPAPIGDGVGQGRAFGRASKTHTIHMHAAVGHGC